MHFPVICLSKIQFAVLPVPLGFTLYIHLNCHRNLSDQTRTRRSKCPQEKKTKRHRTTSLSSAASSSVPPSAETAEAAPELTAAAADASATTSLARSAASLLRTLAPTDSPMSLVRLSLWFYFCLLFDCVDCLTARARSFTIGSGNSYEVYLTGLN